MTCFYKCHVNNFVFLIHHVLQRDPLNNEYIRRFQFCSTTCLHNFKKDFTTEDENGYIYYNEVVYDKLNRCHIMMMEMVEEYKKKQRIQKLNEDNSLSPPAKMSRLN